MSHLVEIDGQVKQWLDELIPFIRESLSDKLTVETKSNHRDLVSNIDKEVEKYLREKITNQFPTHTIIGEESFFDQTNESFDNVWIIDPIDGTTNFLKQQDHFCVLIAYYEQHVGKLGYIYDVMNEDLYHAIENNGAYLNGELLPAPPAISLEEGLVSIDVRHWIGKSCLAQSAEKAFDLRYYGCGGIDSIHVITGKFAAFAVSKSGPWDLAAQLIFAKELGLKVAKFDGSEVSYLDGGDWVLSNRVAYQDISEIVKNFGV